MERKQFAALLFVITFLITVGVTVPNVLAIGAPSINRENFVEPHLQTEVEFFRKNTTTSALHVRIDLDMDSIRVFSMVTGNLIKVLTYKELAERGHMLLIAAIGTAGYTEQVDEYRQSSEFVDEWNVLDISKDSRVYADNNVSRTYVESTPKVINIPDLSVDYNYTFMLLAAETNNTGLQSSLTIVISNTTHTQEITVIQGIWRNKLDLWSSWYNKSLITLGGTCKIVKVKVTNFNYAHLEIYKIRPRLQDHRSVEMIINGQSFSALASKSDVSTTIVGTRDWISDFTSFLYSTPTQISKEGPTLTGAFGWTSLHDVMDQVGKSILGDDYATYTVNNVKMSLEAGAKLGKQIQDTINAAIKQGQDTAEVYGKIIDENLRSVTVALDVNAAALKDNLEQASKTVIDSTNGIIAAISNGISSTPEVILSNINGLTKSVSDSVYGSLTWFSDSIFGVWTAIVNWWNTYWFPLAIILLLIFIIFLLVVGPTIANVILAKLRVITGGAAFGIGK